MKNILIFTFFLFINVLQAQNLVPSQDKNWIAHLPLPNKITFGG